MFLGFVIVAFALFGYLDIWQFLISGSAYTRTANFTADFVSIYFSQNDKDENVVESSYELAVKQTRERTWDLIVARLTAINNITWYRHNSSTSTSQPSVLPSEPSKLYFVPFHHAPDAVHEWNLNSSRRLTLADLPRITVSGADCKAVFRRNKDELRRASEFQETHQKVPVKPLKYIKQASNCTRFVAKRHYATSPVNDEEAEYPIAFSILMFKDVEQFERLLRAVYRPQNLYCVHVDSKSSSDIRGAVIAIARCFENVFVLQRSFDVEWGTFSVLEPELVCMKRLLRRNKKWRYFINLTGQEFPLKTNWQIVRILKAFNGSNNMEGTLQRLVLRN